MDAVTRVPEPVNEPNLGYAPGSPERAEGEAAIARLAGREHERTQPIGGEQRMGTGAVIPAVQPHRHGHVLGRMPEARPAEVRAAIDAARAAAPAWRAMPFDERAAILLRAAALLAGPWRQPLNAAPLPGHAQPGQQAQRD